MNGFEWRWVAAGIGWGSLVGAATGTLIGWVVLFTAVGPSDTSVAEQIAGVLIGLLYMAFYGSLLGFIPGFGCGLVLGLLLSVLVGRQRVEARAVRSTTVTTVVLVPTLAALAIFLMDWYAPELREPWLWLALVIPTVLAVPALRWTARRIVRGRDVREREWPSGTGPDEASVRG